MVFVLAAVFAEPDYLSCSGFAGDVETYHLNARAGTAAVNHIPHSFHDSMIDVFRNRNLLRIWSRGIQRLKTYSCMIVGASGCADRSYFLQEVRNVHLAVHTDC